jgi:hypothetical protein
LTTGQRLRLQEQEEHDGMAEFVLLFRVWRQRLCPLAL